MNDCMKLNIQSQAQSFANEMHSSMIAEDIHYAASVAAGQTTAWAIPYVDSGKWYVNVKERGRKAVKEADKVKLKPIKEKVE